MIDEINELKIKIHGQMNKNQKTKQSVNREL